MQLVSAGIAGEVPQKTSVFRVWIGAFTLKRDEPGAQRALGRDASEVISWIVEQHLAKGAGRAWLGQVPLRYGLRSDASFDTPHPVT